MTNNNWVKIVVFAPETHADRIREAISSAGAGIIGNYTNCTFSTKGIGRFKPIEGAHPTTGQIDKLEEVKEERIETVCERARLKEVVAVIKKASPYEETALDVYPLEDIGF